jgi:hypothetical protein
MSWERLFIAPEMMYDTYTPLRNVFVIRAWWYRQQAPQKRETSVNLYQTARRSNPEDGHFGAVTLNEMPVRFIQTDRLHRSAGEMQHTKGPF